VRTLEIVLFIANFQAFINTKVILLTKRWDQESYCEVPSYSLFSLCQILLWIKKFDNLSVSCLTRAERSRVSEWRQRSVTAAGNGRHTDAVVSSSQSTGRWTTELAAGRCSDISSYIQVGGFLLFKCDSGATREIIKKKQLTGVSHFTNCIMHTSRVHDGPQFRCDASNTSARQSLSFFW